MTSKVSKEVAVLLATAVTTLLTCIVLAFIDLTTSFSLYGFSLWFVVPIGALFSGFVAASGCYLAGRLLNYKPTLTLLIGVLVLSALAFFLINYLDYYFSTVNGQQVRDFISFTQYLNISLNNMSICVRGCIGGSVDLGALGYGAAGLQILGFFVGGASAYAYLSSQKYCTACSRYLTPKKTEECYFPDVASAAQPYGEVLNLLQGGQFHAALTQQAVTGEETRQRYFGAASELQLWYCTNCLRHRICVALQKRDERDERKNDWKTVPHTEAEFETAPRFYPSSDTSPTPTLFS